MLLYNVGLTFLLQYSLLNFNPMIVGVDDDLMFYILNLVKTSATYFDWEIEIPFSVFFTSMPKKYLNKPKSVISNSLFMAVLKSTMRETSLPVKIKSST